MFMSDKAEVPALFLVYKIKKSTYLPILKLMSRSTANKELFKDGLAFLYGNEIKQNLVPGPSQC